VIAVDTNVLVYAHRAESEFFDAASACIKSLAEGARPWGIPVNCVHEFLAVVTNPKVFTPASTTDQALAQIDAWLASPQASVLHSGQQHWKVLADLSRKAKLKGGQFHDARIAAVCLENAVTVLWTADRDFSRFKGLKTVNPLI
jgi:uncharacterized protein